jgi:hypothetical protein
MLMRLRVALLLLLLSSSACTSDESDEGLFSVRLTPQGGQTVTVTGDSLIYDFLPCGTMTGTCSTAGIIFYPSGSGGFNGPILVSLSANNIPVVEGRLTTGTFPFNDVSTFDIFAEFDDQNDGWSSNLGGTLTVTTSTATRLAGSFQFVGYDNPPDSMPPVTVRVTFDFPLP